MSYYLEPDSHIIDKIKVVLDFSNYATEKELEHITTCIDISDLATKMILLFIKMIFIYINMFQLV